jgi:hypothetical protein
MSHVSIIGGGNAGRAIATIVTKGGNTVEVLNNNDADKPVTGDVVFLAVPYPAVADVLQHRGDQLAGKVVVGLTKDPLSFETFDSPVVPADASSTATFASSLPQSSALNPVGRASSTPVRQPAPASWKLSASCRSSSPPPRSRPGPAGSPSSADGLAGWHHAPDEGSNWWWYLGMFVLILTLFALLTLLYRQ